MNFRSLLLLLGCAALGLASVAGCNSVTRSQSNVNSPPAIDGKPLPVAADHVPRISIAEAKAAFDRGEAVIIDVRPLESYKQEHIKGSISIPNSDTAARLNELPKSKLIIAYCS
jgi:hypothetical protein